MPGGSCYQLAEDLVASTQAAKFGKTFAASAERCARRLASSSSSSSCARPPLPQSPRSLDTATFHVEHDKILMGLFLSDAFHKVMVVAIWVGTAQPEFTVAEIILVEQESAAESVKITRRGLSQLQAHLVAGGKEALGCCILHARGSRHPTVMDMKLHRQLGLQQENGILGTFWGKGVEQMRGVTYWQTSASLQELSELEWPHDADPAFASRYLRPFFFNTSELVPLPVVLKLGVVLSASNVAVAPTSVQMVAAPVHATVCALEKARASELLHHLKGICAQTGRSKLDSADWLATAPMPASSYGELVKSLRAALADLQKRKVIKITWKSKSHSDLADVVVEILGASSIAA